jgi:hypothetical protein
VLDGERCEIRVIRRGEPDVVVRDSLVWRVVVAEPLVLDVVALFG